ncbi:MAG TPA: glycine/sarcosine/betaine reductase selenoprotein B family protein [Nitrolancea sp.]|nr:glycine/sarcosine/betaine reductase selenoprotein B family protein [Nitrolancea sp.]
MTRMLESGSETGHGVNFAEIEREWVRSRFYSPFDWVAFDDYSPYNVLAGPVQNARVAFVTTSGAYHRDQPAFDLESAAGDPSFRFFPSATSLADIQLSHRGYNTSRASDDKNVVLPLEHLQATQNEGRIGELAPTVYSFMGYIADPEPLVRETAPTVAKQLLADRVDLVLLAPT